LERKKKREQEQQQAEAERKQRKRQQEQQQQKTKKQQQKAQQNTQKKPQPEVSRHRNNPSTLHTSTASSLVHTASFKASSSSSSSSSSTSSSATSPTHSQLRQLTRTIDSMETTRASIARRTEHDKKALVAEYESKISLIGAERESEKRDMQLSMDRQQDTILRLKRSATDLQQQLTDKVAASQREREGNQWWRKWSVLHAPFSIVVLISFSFFFCHSVVWWLSCVVLFFLCVCPVRI
jgi:hypothetical protein